MKPLRLLSGLSEIAPEYDALICDVWGVLHNGRTVLPGAAAALARFRRDRGPVVLLTNAPRTPQEVILQFARFGVPPDCYDTIVSSGSVARDELAARAAAHGGKLPIYFIGPDDDASIAEGLAVTRTTVAEAEVALCVGLRKDLVETPADYADELSRLRARNLVMLCANPDLRVHRGDKLVWCAGALARDYEALGGQVIYYGKPHAPVYDAARAAAGSGRALAIGDGLHTDVKGANAQGLDVLFIADGVHGAEVGGFTPEDLARLLDAHGLHAQAALKMLVW